MKNNNKKSQILWRSFWSLCSAVVETVRWLGEEIKWGNDSRVQSNSLIGFTHHKLLMSGRCIKNLPQDDYHKTENNLEIIGTNHPPNFYNSTPMISKDSSDESFSLYLSQVATSLWQNSAVLLWLSLQSKASINNSLPFSPRTLSSAPHIFINSPISCVY